jgi:hypothetical protein
MNGRSLAVACAFALCLIAAIPAAAQVQLLNLQADVPIAVTLDNPCTAAPEAIAFTGTTHLNQQVWLMPGGTTRLAVSESTSIQGKNVLVLFGSPTYTGSGADAVDAEFSPGAASIYNYKRVINSATQDTFYAIVQLDFDPASLRLNVSVTGSCDDGSPTTP